MSDQMLPMQNARGEKFAFKHAPGDPQHAWVFYDNHGTWVTLRPALPAEIARAAALIEFQQRLDGIPCRPPAA